VPRHIIHCFGSVAAFMLVRMDGDRPQLLKEFLQGVALIIATTGAIAFALELLRAVTFQVVQAP